jgi:hypothetical protein
MLHVSGPHTPHCLLRLPHVQVLNQHRITAKGLAGCGINTAAAVGTAYNVTFWVWDSGQPVLNATINRTVRTPPCLYGAGGCAWLGWVLCCCHLPHGSARPSVVRSWLLLMPAAHQPRSMPQQLKCWIPHALQ